MKTLKLLIVLGITIIFFSITYKMELKDLPALVISLVALIYAAETYMLKSGNHIRGIYETTWFNNDSDEVFINRIILENLKDKSIVVFRISMQIGENYFLLIEEFKDEPLIIKPFEVYQKTYQTVYCYVGEFIKIDIADLIADHNIEKKFILSTSSGRYEVKETIDFHHPLIEVNLNKCLTAVQPKRVMYKERFLGKNVSYIVEIDNNEIIFLHHGDEKRSIFKNFHLTKDSLENKNNLQIFLEQQKKLGNINYQSLRLTDAKDIFNNFEKYYVKTIKAEVNGTLMSKVKCKLDKYLNLLERKIRDIVIKYSK